MIQKIVLGIVILIVSIPMAIPAVYLTIDTFTNTIDKCNSLGGQFNSSVFSPNHCYAIVDGQLVDLFND